MASSFRREVTRASSRLPTFAAAISRRKAAAPSSTSSAGRTRPTSCSCSGTRVASIIQVSSPYCCFSRRAIELTSARACSTVTPSLRRPTTWKL